MSPVSYWPDDILLDPDHIPAQAEQQGPGGDPEDDHPADPTQDPNNRFGRICATCGAAVTFESAAVPGGRGRTVHASNARR